MLGAQLGLPPRRPAKRLASDILRGPPCTAPSDTSSSGRQPGSGAAPEWRIVAGFDVGRTRNRSELVRCSRRSRPASPRACCANFEGIPVAEQENLSRDFPQVVGENFTNESKERWATDLKILVQGRNVTLPRERELVG